MTSSYFWYTTEAGKVWGTSSSLNPLSNDGEPYPELLAVHEISFGSPVIEIREGGLSDDDSEYWRFAYERAIVIWQRDT